jgi:hypothetical protein
MTLQNICLITIFMLTIFMLKQSKTHFLLLNTYDDILKNLATQYPQLVYENLLVHKMSLFRFLVINPSSKIWQRFTPPRPNLYSLTLRRKSILRSL